MPGSSDLDWKQPALQTFVPILGRACHQSLGNQLIACHMPGCCIVLSAAVGISCSGCGLLLEPLPNGCLSLSCLVLHNAPPMCPLLFTVLIAQMLLLVSMGDPLPNPGNEQLDGCCTALSVRDPQFHAQSSSGLGSPNVGEHANELTIFIFAHIRSRHCTMLELRLGMPIGC